MATVVLNRSTVYQIPKQYVYIDGKLDPSLVCTTVQVTSTGAVAAFDAPLQMFDSDKAPYLSKPVVVMVEGSSQPIFRGFLDASHAELRGERVTMQARSALSYLREHPLVERRAYNGAQSGVGTEISFPATVPEHVDMPTPRVWHPHEILATLAAVTLSDWWVQNISLILDPSVSAVQPVDNQVKSFSVGQNGVEIVTVTRRESPLGDQVFRGGTWGQVLDFMVELCPGLVLSEVFTFSKSIVYFYYIARCGSVTLPVGVRGYDWSSVGAVVSDLSVDTAAGDAYNRICGFGAPLEFVVSLVSEHFVDVSGSRKASKGLVPDWPIYDIAAPLQTPAPATDELIAASSFNYVNGKYASTVGDMRLFEQLAKTVIESPQLADPESPAFNKKYEFVLRRYRLPALFSKFEVVSASDLLPDIKSGGTGALQVFVECVVAKDGKHVYVMQPATDWEFDYGRKAVIFKRPQICPVLDQHGAITDKQKAAKVAVTLVCRTTQYQLMVDSWLNQQVPPNLDLPIGSGRTFAFERPDLRRVLISNIGYPFTTEYLDFAPEPSTYTESGYFVPEKQTTPYNVTYKDFLLSLTDKSGRTALAIYSATVAQPPIGEQVGSELSTALTILDQAPVLADAVAKIFWRKCKRPRQFSIQVPFLVCGLLRGQVVSIANLSNNYSPDCDMIDSIVYDLVEAKTDIKTTNTPAEIYGVERVLV